MKRRSFLKFFGLAPAAAVAPKVAEAVESAFPEEAVAEIDTYAISTGYEEMDCFSAVPCPVDFVRMKDLIAQSKRKVPFK